MARTKDWPHAPVHRIDAHGIYMVTGATLHKAHLFSSDEKLNLLEEKLLTLAKQCHWQLEAWAVFVNHYHFVARGHSGTLPLDAFLNQLHSDTARNLNQLDQLTGREVWFNFWDTKLTYERSYLARLNYVHQNAVKHRLVNVANQYPWLSRCNGSSMTRFRRQCALDSTPWSAAAWRRFCHPRAI